ncbi:hypothetical protein [uncultured Roseivirga sp.]|uniref:hypothetical protein n=1 Tax=uncultured Roseivirga sp. TaxID=543088 RepID=UPI0030DC237C
MSNKRNLPKPLNLLGKDINTDMGSGVRIADLKKLFDYIPSKEILDRLFKKELESDEFINIPGAQTLVTETIKFEKKLKKFDLTKGLNEVECLEIGGQNSLTLKFKDITEDKPELNTHSIKAETIHSAKSEFLEENFKIKKFSDFLYSQELAQIALENISKLTSVFAERKSDKRKYRLIEFEGNYFLRGITSETYEDYNIPFSICLCLLTIHRSYKNGSRNFKVKSIFIDDSNIEVLFESDQKVRLGNLGSLKHSIILSNDEIRRQAVGILGISSIEFTSNDGENRQVFFQPKKRLESAIFKIDHRSTKDDTILSGVQNFTELVVASEKNFIKVFKHLENATDPTLLKFRIQEAIKNSREDSIKPYKEDFKTMLKSEVNNMISLLEIMNRLSLIAQNDLDAKQYIRYLFYKEIIKRPTK